MMKIERAVVNCQAVFSEHQGALGSLSSSSAVELSKSGCRTTSPRLRWNIEEMVLLARLKYPGRGPQNEVIETL